MRKALVTVMLGLLIAGLTASSASCDISFGLSGDEDGLKSFYLAIGDHYKAPEKEVVIVRKASIPDDEMSVVFHIARHAGVTVEAVVKLRVKGMSWMEITRHYGMTAEIFYVPMKTDPGPPYGHAWGLYKKTKREKWNEIRLADVDIVNFVNLKFVSEQNGCTPAEVIKLRKNGQGFVNIHGAMKKAHKQKQQKLADSDNSGAKSKTKKNKGQKK